MAAPGWSERVRELLKRMNSFHGPGSSKAQCLPFLVAGQQVGHVSPSVAKCLHRYPAVFSVSLADETRPCVELNKQLVSYEQRTSAVEGMLRELREQQAFPCLKEWREELYGVMPYFCDTPLFSMERAATPLLGVKRYGAHLNGYTWRNGQMYMWLGRRALNKPTYPGLLDNLVKEAIGSTDFKPNCAMVALDFLIRHSYIEPDKEPHYVEFVEGLHRKL